MLSTNDSSIKSSEILEKLALKFDWKINDLFRNDGKHHNITLMQRKYDSLGRCRHHRIWWQKENVFHGQWFSSFSAHTSQFLKSPDYETACEEALEILSGANLGLLSSTGDIKSLMQLPAFTSFEELKLKLEIQEIGEEDEQC